MSFLRLLLSADLLQHAFGTQTLFTADRLEIHDGDRIGLVAKNGGGKTTLLRILAGELTPESGTVDRRCEIALIHQPDATADDPSDADDPLLPRLDPRLRGELGGGAGKSGGERTRLAIAAAFAQNAPLLLADEPATNLDLDGVLLLERQLAAYPGGVVLVAHDRALLDAVCTTIWAIEEDGALRVFPGNYSAWAAQKEQERDFAQFEYDQFRSEQRRLTSELHAIREHARGMTRAPSRMGNSEARLHKGTIPAKQKEVQRRAKTMRARIDRLDTKPVPAKLPEVRMDCGSTSPVVSKTAARIEHLTVRYGDHLVLQDASCALPTGSKTVMLGGNGAGKSTLAAHLVQGGDCARISGGIKLGYFAQGHEQLDLSRTVLENVRLHSPLPESDVRTILARLGIAGDAVHKAVSVLSGGERAKTAFASLLASDCNLLVFDEPTNHIDFYTADALESLLAAWSGTLLVVTHDRRLAQRLAERLLFVENATVRTFDGDWDAWQTAQSSAAKSKDDEAARLAALMDAMRRSAEG